MNVKNKVYSNYIYDREVSSNYEIAANSYQTEVRTRLSIEVNAAYKAGLVGITLVLTYNDAHVPTWKGYRVYNHEHIRTFLNRLKVYSRRQSLSPYKYFICSEYGSEKSRPHYHILLLINNNFANIRGYITLIRNIWQNAMNNGFVLPFESENPVEKAQLRSKGSAVAYIAKYVTKSIDYRDCNKTAMLKDAIRNCVYDGEKRKLRDKLPRIYQSNGMGNIHISNIDDLLDKMAQGVRLPFTTKYVSLPRYVINKFLYRSVKSFGNRLGKDDKILYDRQPRNIEDMYIYFYYKLNRLRYTYETSYLDYSDKLPAVSSFLDYFHNTSYKINPFTALTAYNTIKHATMNGAYTCKINSSASLFSIKKATDLLTLQSNAYDRYELNQDYMNGNCMDNPMFIKNRHKSKLLKYVELAINELENFRESRIMRNINRFKELNKTIEKHRVKRYDDSLFTN